MSSIQVSCQQDSTVQDQKRDTQIPPQTASVGMGGDSQEPVIEETDLSNLSLSEKMALFNSLSHATKKTAEGSRGDTRLRRANPRFQTQPITKGEVNKVKKKTNQKTKHFSSASQSCL